VIVCEGYMDVISLSQAGFAESVAALGTAITSQHVATLLRLSPHVVFAFDGDAAGRKAARRALEATLPVIGEDRRASFLLLPQGEDPDSLVREHGPAALEDELARALSLSQWLLRTLSEGLDLGEPEGRASLLSAARPLLSSMAPGAARTPPQDLEALFGLTPWRRLPEVRSGRAPHPREHLRVEGLKHRLLQRLLAFPSLARECNAQIAALAVDGQEDVDRQIAEVWRAATATGSPHSGAVLEALAASEHAALYRSLAARDLEGEEDPQEAMTLALDDLRAGFAALEEERVAAEMDALARGPMSPGEQERYRELAARRNVLRLERTQASRDRSD
jgi:DNA primase